MGCGCAMCEGRCDWNDDKQMYCEMCGAELDYSDFVYIVKGQDDVVGCEHCITALCADELEKY